MFCNCSKPMMQYFCDKSCYCYGRVKEQELWYWVELVLWMPGSECLCAITAHPGWTVECKLSSLWKTATTLTTIQKLFFSEFYSVWWSHSKTSKPTFSWDVEVHGCGKRRGCICYLWKHVKRITGITDWNVDGCLWQTEIPSSLQAGQRGNPRENKNHEMNATKWHPRPSQHQSVYFS